MAAPCNSRAMPAAFPINSQRCSPRWTRTSLPSVLRLLVLIALIALVERAQAQDAPTLDSDTSTPDALFADAVPRFSDYPARAYIGPRAPLQRIPRSAQSDIVANTNALSDAYRAAPDFNGSMVIGKLTCGTGCVDGYAMDHRNGRIVRLPRAQHHFLTVGYRYRRDSALLWVEYSILDDTQHCRAMAYYFTRGRFVLLADRTHAQCSFERPSER